MVAKLLRPAAALGADADQLAVELDETAQDGQQQPAVRRDGVGPCGAERMEAGLVLVY